jgi:hypothetical protein
MEAHPRKEKLGYYGTGARRGGSRRRRTWAFSFFTALAVALASLAVTGSARSAGSGPPADLLANALARATRYWHATPCGGRFRVLPDRSVKEGLVYGWATFDVAPGSPSSLSAPPVAYTNCVIHLNGSWFGTRRQDTEEWWSFCITIVHEYGHLLGHGHTLPPRPYDVMNAEPLLWGSLPMCGDRPSERYGHVGGS